jgi:ABC-type dipeptide transport system, periplasmic component
MRLASKSIGVIIILAILASVLVGCGDSSTNGQSTQTEKRIAYYAFNTEPYIDLDPSSEYSNGLIVLHNIYETLTRYDSNEEVVKPLLAESWDVSEDGMTWTFRIREGVKFHDGSDLDAESVKKSIDRTKKLQMGASFIWDSVNSINVIDEYTVEFVLDYPAPIDLIASGSYAAFIMSPETIDKDNQWFNEGNASGTGPYKLQKITKGEEVILEKFDDYWNGWNDNQYTNIVIKKVAEGSARRQLLEKGDAQIAASFSVTDLKALRENTNVVVKDADTWRNVIGFFNTEKAPLDNPDFRRAMAYAFPYEETITEIKEGLASKSYGLIPKGLWGHDENLNQYSFDLEKAKEYIEKSGVDTNGLKLEMTFTSGTEAYRNFAQLYKINLQQLGIELEIREMNWDNVWEKAKNPSPQDRQDIVIMNWWPDYASPLSWVQSLVRSEEDILFNLSYIKDQNLDNLVMEFEKYAATDRSKAEELIKEIQSEVIDEAYFLHIYDDKTSWVMDKNFKGFEPNPAYEGVVFFYYTYYGE